jgi:hypothetical protein
MNLNKFVQLVQVAGNNIQQNPVKRTTRFLNDKGMQLLLLFTIHLNKTKLLVDVVIR